MFEGQEDRAHIGVENSVEDIAVLMFQRGGPFLITGIVEGCVQPAEPRDNGLHEMADIFFPRHVRAQEQALGASCTAGLCDSLSFLVTTAGNDDRGRSSLRHPQCRRPADAAAASGDQADQAIHPACFPPGADIRGFG